MKQYTICQQCGHVVIDHAIDECPICCASGDLLVTNLFNSEILSSDIIDFTNPDLQVTITNTN